MEEMSISKFKATCLAVLENVRTSGQPILVTRFGEPVAEVIPPSSSNRKMRRMGGMAGTVHILGDIVSAAGDEVDGKTRRG